MKRNKKRSQHFQGRAGGQEESSRNERDVGQPWFKEGKKPGWFKEGSKRENWVVLGATAERSSRALLPLSTINQEGKTNLERVRN